jgi:hypothetical protein
MPTTYTAIHRFVNYYEHAGTHRQLARYYCIDTDIVIKNSKFLTDYCSNNDWATGTVFSNYLICNINKDLNTIIEAFWLYIHNVTDFERRDPVPSFNVTLDNISNYIKLGFPFNLKIIILFRKELNNALFDNIKNVTNYKKELNDLNEKMELYNNYNSCNLGIEYNELLENFYSVILEKNGDIPNNNEELEKIISEYDTNINHSWMNTSKTEAIITKHMGSLHTFKHFSELFNKGKIINTIDFDIEDKIRKYVSLIEEKNNIIKQIKEYIELMSHI